jgi:hypothetical protein
MRGEGVGAKSFLLTFVGRLGFAVMPSLLRPHG